MPTVFLSLGANLQDPFDTLQKAIDAIRSLEEVFFIKTSSIYKTSPVSTVAQNDYLNLVCQIETDLNIELLFSKLEQIELFLGKKKKGKADPRIIDIDLLFYGNKSIKTQKLQVPHKEWKNRLFVLVPLKEITNFITLATMGTIDLSSLINNFRSNMPQTINKYHRKIQCKT